MHTATTKYPASTRRTRCLLLMLALAWLSTGTQAQTTFTNVTADLPNLQFGSWGASWVDYDGDGALDLFIGRGQGGMLLRNTGSGFEDATGDALANGGGILGHCWGDYDNDGDPDVMAAGNPSVLYRNDGGNVFTPVTDGIIGEQAANRGWSCDWGDYDDDGFLDLIIAHATPFVGSPVPNHLFHNNGDGTFSRVTDTPITDGLDAYTIPSWADYDLDGDLDLFIGSGPARGTREPDNLYRNLLAETGTATFERITGINIADDARDGQVMNWIDYDNDGDFDLFVTNYWGRGDESESENPDFLSMPPSFYRNEGDGTFTKLRNETTTGTTGFDLSNTWGDVDNDGDLDLLIVTARQTLGAGEERLFYNNGDGTFTRATEGELVTERTTSAGGTFGDYDDDGDLDLFITSVSGGAPQNRLFRNDLDNSNAWIKLNLEGTTSNRSALGTIVRAAAVINGTSVTQMQRVSAQNTFAGQNSSTVHFGFGDADTITELTFLWPSGLQETVRNVEVNQTGTIVEGMAADGIAVGINDVEAVPDAFRLDGNYPNPFNPSTTIRYEVPRPQAVTLAIYDLRGRAIKTLLDGPAPAGSGTVMWDGTDAAGQRAPSGVYLSQLRAADGTVVSRPLVLLK